MSFSSTLMVSVSRYDPNKLGLFGAVQLGRRLQLLHYRRKKMATAPGLVRIAVVGDVHGYWNPVVDEKALRFLRPDLVLFTGDFGEEDVELVKQISNLNMPKAVILGNHDCWWSAQRQHQRKQNHLPVQEQITALGDSYVGFKCLDFSNLKLSVVGVRPFSMGGVKMFYREHLALQYGIMDIKASAAKISELAFAAPEDHILVFLGHNGPTGLGSKPDDICGKDFVPRAGDHGDPDLEEALKICQKDGKCKVPLVVFGHMHKELAFQPGNRKMIAVGSNGTIYVNGAIVPRERRDSVERVFTMVELCGGKVKKVTESWIAVKEAVEVAEETLLYSAQ